MTIQKNAGRKTLGMIAASLLVSSANAGLLSTVTDTLTNGISASPESSVTIERCVKVPGTDGLFLGVATPLTGPIGVDVPSLTETTLCAQTVCDVAGAVEVTQAADSFSDCDVAYTVDGFAEGSCTTTITAKTLLGERTIYAETARSVDGEPLLPLEVCAAKTE